MSRPDVVVLFEHPEWQKPLFAALEKRGVSFAAFDLKRATFADFDVPAAPLYFNQASPSAYVRGHTRAVPFALSFMRTLELSGARVLNGSAAFALELSKSAQAALLRRLGIATPRSITFNDVSALRARASELAWPALVKPEQGGSGARMELCENIDALEALLAARPEMWSPDNLLLAQEYLPSDPERGIIRMEFVGGKLLYAMRVVSHGRFNLCPAPVCNPDTGEGHCEIPRAAERKAPPVEFFPFPEVPREAVEEGERIVKAGGLDVAGLEYLETAGGQRFFYDINANSNLRPSVAAAFGFDPFERVVDFLVSEIGQARARVAA